MSEKVDSVALHALGRRTSNRGRWGEHDARGALNWITPARLLAACALPRRGQVISCGLPFQPPEPRGAPLTWLGRHGGSIDAARDGVMARGVLLDLPRLLRRPWLEDGTRLHPEDLEACAEAQGVTIESGDALLLRTGKLGRHLRDENLEDYHASAAPGLALDCAEWIHGREIALLAADTAQVEALPYESSDCQMPLRSVALAETGLLWGESFALDALAAACAADGEYAFLFAAPPLPAVGADGSPVNPLAIR